MPAADFKLNAGIAGAGAEVDVSAQVAGCVLLVSVKAGGVNDGMEKSDLGADGADAGVGPGSDTAGELLGAS